MSKARLYVVTTMHSDTAQLVEGISHAQVLNHVTKDTVTIKPATPLEVAELCTAGVKVEKAGGEA